VGVGGVGGVAVENGGREGGGEMMLRWRNRQGREVRAISQMEEEVKIKKRANSKGRLRNGGHDEE